MSLNHPEPEVRELQKMADDDENVGLFVRLACEKHGVTSLTKMFELDSGAVFELHDAMCDLVGQLPKDVL